MASSLRLRDHVRREWRHSPPQGALGLALVGIVGIAFNHLVLPLFPPRVIDFMMRGFRLEDLGAVMVLNDLMAVYFPAFFAGLASSLGVVLTARDEHRLEILLAKPIRAADFVAARTLPILVGTAIVGTTISAASAVAVALDAGVGTSTTPGGAFGAGLSVTALTIVLLAALQIAFVRLRDPLMGLLVACVTWLATVIPTAVLLYRPDVYDGRDALADAIVLPTLLWHPATAAWAGPVAMALALPVAAVLARAAGAVLERSDAM
jgi:hypothetical protein